jgi:hypothetical protein
MARFSSLPVAYGRAGLEYPNAGENSVWYARRPAASPTSADPTAIAVTLELLFDVEVARDDFDVAVEKALRSRLARGSGASSLRKAGGIEAAREGMQC